MNIVEVAKNKDTILKHDNEVYCNECQHQFHSPFDKLYITAVGACYVCIEDDNVSDNIFKLI